MREVPFDEGRLRRALAGRHVLLTGHTGFKGGWMALWLRRLGADVTAVALPPCYGQPSFFDEVGIAELVDHRIADIGDPDALGAVLAGVDADLVIHMAAQALVRPSYARPVETFRTNVVGTAAVLDAARAMPSLKGIVIVTSDKCYQNREWSWSYREVDRLGGKDPYSASKACAELVTAAYRRSFFDEPGAPLVASARAGNVFGGGDWAEDRLVPDLMRAVAAHQPLHIRNPASVRPWQHVLEPLAGYLQLAAGLLDGDSRFAEAWNFGPDGDGTVSVEMLAGLFRTAWSGPELRFLFGPPETGLAEAGLLKLDSSRAKSLIGWRPRLSLESAVELTVEWYRSFFAGNSDMRRLSERQIDLYVGAASGRTDSELDMKVVACA